jgi:hypothetical protein
MQPIKVEDRVPTMLEAGAFAVVAVVTCYVLFVLWSLFRFFQLLVS